MIAAMRDMVRGLRELGRVVRTGDGSTLTLGGLAQAWLTGADAEVPGSSRLARPYRQHPTAYVAINRIATAIAQLEVEVYDGGEQADGDTAAGLRAGVGPGLEQYARSSKSRRGELVPGHWLPSLLMNPDPENPNANRAGQLIEASVASLQLCGEAFLWHRDIARRGASNPRRPWGLKWLAPREMTWDSEAEVWKWNGGGGASVPIPREELTYLRCHNPYDEVRGLGPMQAALMEASTDYSAALWNSSFFNNSAQPTTVFKSRKSWRKADRRDFLAGWNAEFRGPANTAKAAALPGGVDVTQLKLTHEEMDFLAGRRFNREQVLGVFGVPPVIGGVFEFANYANSREQMKIFWEVTLLPLACYVQAVLTLDLLQRYQPGLTAWFKVEPVLSRVLAGEFAEKVATARKLWDMGWSAQAVNDRLELGLDTDGMPWLEEGFLPAGMKLASDILDPPNPPPIPPVPPPPPQDEDEPEDDETPEGDDEERHAPPERSQRMVKRALRSWLWSVRREVLESIAAKGEGAKSWGSYGYDHDTAARQLRDLVVSELAVGTLAELDDRLLAAHDDWRRDGAELSDLKRRQRKVFDEMRQQTPELARRAVEMER